MKKILLMLGTATVTLFAVSLCDTIQEDELIKSKQRIMDYISNSQVKDKIVSIDNVEYRDSLLHKYTKICYNLCIYYKVDQEDDYRLAIDNLLNDVKMYHVLTRINLVF